VSDRRERERSESRHGWKLTGKERTQQRKKESERDEGQNPKEICIALLSNARLCWNENKT